MAEVPAAPGGSPGPAAAPSPRGSAGPQEDERCPGGASPETAGAAPGKNQETPSGKRSPDITEPLFPSDSTATAAGAEAIPEPPGGTGTPGSSGEKEKSAGGSCGDFPVEKEKSAGGSCRDLPVEKEKFPGGSCGDLPVEKENSPGGSCGDLPLGSSMAKENSPGGSFGTLPPLPPQGRRRSWRRCSLKGRRSRRKSLPPVHRDVSELSQSISLELPEVQRLSLLLLSSFQFCAQKLQQSQGLDPEAFAARAQAGTEEFQRLLQRLLQDGTLGRCLSPGPGDSLDPGLDGFVGQLQGLMDSLSGELQAWDRLLQQHLQRSQDTSRALEQLRAGSPPWNLGIPHSQILESKPDYGAVLARQRPRLRALGLLVDEAQQAGKMVLEFQRESHNFLRGLSEQLASRTFRNLPGSPVRRLLEQRPRKAEGGQ